MIIPSVSPVGKLDKPGLLMRPMRCSWKRQNKPDGGPFSWACFVNSHGAQKAQRDTLPHALTTHSPHASQLALAGVNGIYVSVVQISPSPSPWQCSSNTSHCYIYIYIYIYTNVWWESGQDAHSHIHLLLSCCTQGRFVFFLFINLSSTEAGAERPVAVPPLTPPPLTELDGVEDVVSAFSFCLVTCLFCFCFFLFFFSLQRVTTVDSAELFQKCVCRAMNHEHIFVHRSLVVLFENKHWLNTINWWAMYVCVCVWCQVLMLANFSRQTKR